ncbi:MAG: hypothetical protein H0V17_25045 [Deltaproteobacteria bacterium]|nr:hypothetical protein [Deltaproteobacteria bacterium]
MQLVEVLEQLRAVVPNGHAIATKLAGTTKPARVLDVLCDRKRSRVLTSPVAGVVEVLGGELVAFKLVNFRVLVRTKEGELSEDAIEWTRTYTHDNPFGCWADVGWLVLAPDELLVTRGASIDAHEPLARCRVTLDQLVDTHGERALLATFAEELPELTPGEAEQVAIAMTDHVEAYQSSDDCSTRTNATLMRKADFEAHNAEAAHPVYGRSCVLSIPALTKAATSTSPAGPVA